MEDQTPAPKGDDMTAKVDQASGEAVTQTPKALAEEDINERLLRESQKNKARAVEAEARLRSIEEDRMKEKEQYKELAEKYRQENESLHRDRVQRSLERSVESIASKEGCLDVKALMKLGNGKLLNYDSDSGEVFGVEMFLKDAREKYGYLFKSGPKSVINPVAPSGEVKRKAPASTRDQVRTNEGFRGALADALKNKGA